MSPKRIAAALLLFVGCVEGAPLTGASREVNQIDAVTSPIVVELFTSQGCSSCPPADSLLADLQQEYSSTQRPLLCLSFHVDYWNRLGWTDPFSSPASTDRQHQYAAAQHSNRVYTPQMIVGGVDAFVGSNRQLATAAIAAQAQTQPSAKLALKQRPESGTDRVSIDYEVRGSFEECRLNLAAIEPRAGNEALAGENSGRRLEHVNVVRWFKSVPLRGGAGDGKDSGTVAIDLPAGLQGLEIVGYVQEAETMKIVGAATAR